MRKEAAQEWRIIMRYITIALAKGRLAKNALDIFEHIGITCDEMKDEKTRKLIFTNEELGIRFFLQNHQMYQHMLNMVQLTLELLEKILF